MYAAWSKGTPSQAKEDVEMWQLGVVAAVICIGFITYGYNIMKGEFPTACPVYGRDRD
jgi:sodium-dependent phosphate transporter